MKPSGNLRARVLAREWVVGTFINLGSPMTAEIAGLAGFDWVLIDHEHGPGGEETLLHQLHAVSGTSAVPIVRIAFNETPRFKRVLDVGAHGVMIPLVSSAADARAAVAAMRYPPRGIRGVAKFHRSVGFGADFDDYYQHAHEWLISVIQIETPEAVSAIDEIAAVDGVDVLFVGPTDLSYNMGIPDQLEGEEFTAALRKVSEAAKRHGKAAGALVHSPALVPRLKELGYTFVALGSDGGAVRAGLTSFLKALRA